MGWFGKTTEFKQVTSSPPVRSRLVKRFECAAFFYIAVPSFLALLSGLSSSGNQLFKHPHYSILYWLCTAIPAWAAAGLGTAVVSLALKRFLDPKRLHESFLLILALGYLAGINVIWMPLAELRNEFLGGLAMPGQSLRHAWEPSSPYLAVYQVTHGLACWIGFNYLVAALFGMPRFGFFIDCSCFTRLFDRAKVALERRDKTLRNIHDNLSKSEIEAREELTNRISPFPLESIIAMRAEDHYTQVYFDNAELLIYMRFSSAIQGTVLLDGFQTHRSYWVRVESVRKAVTRGGKKFLELHTGRLVPISRERRSSVHDLLTEKWA